MLNRTPAWLSVIAVVCVATFLAAGVARADVCQEHFQGKTLRWIASGSAGGMYDVIARLVAPHVARELGAKVVFESLYGGSGLIAMNAITAAGSDGTTVGVASGAQTLMGAFDGRLPDPARGLTLLGQMQGSRYVWAVSKDSEIRSMESLFRIAKERPIVFPIYEPKGGSFTRLVAQTVLLGIPTQLVSGYRGGGAMAMAAIRNEVDLVSVGVEGRVDLFANGDLIPILQVTEEAMPGPLFEGLPHLFGPDGLVERRTRELGRDPAQAALEAEGLAAYLNLGRIFVAPKETRPDLVPCMRSTLARAFASPALRADFEAADRLFSFETAAETTRHIDTARELLPTFGPAVEEARAALRR